MSKQKDKWQQEVEGKFTQTRVAMIKMMFKKFMIKEKKKVERMLTCNVAPLLRILRLNPLESEIKDLIEEVDPDKEGIITFHQFLYLLWRKTQTEDEEDIVTAFQVFDIDGDGIIPLEVLKSILTKKGEKLNELEFQAFAEAADINEDGLIDFKNFADRMNAEDTEVKGKKGKKKKKKK